MSVGLLPVTVVGAGPPERGPIGVAFPPAQLQNETYIWQVAQTDEGQIVASGERVGFYVDQRWEFLPQPRKAAVRSLFVDGKTLWVGSQNELGRFDLPLTSHSRYEKLAIPELETAGEIWHVTKSGATLVVVTANKVYLIDPASTHTVVHELANRSRLALVAAHDRQIVAHPGTGLWEVKGGELRPLPNPLPDQTDISWLIYDDEFILTLKALYRKTPDGYRKAVDLTTVSKAVIASASSWGNFLVLATYSKGLALLDAASGQVDWVTRASGLTSLTTTFSFVDRAGRLWIGTNNGVALFESFRFGHRLAPPDPPLVAAQAGGLYVGYDDRMDFFRDDGQTETFPRSQSLKQTKHGMALGLLGKLRVGEKEYATPGNRVGSVAELPSGDLLASVASHLYRIDFSAQTSTLVPGVSLDFDSLATVGDTVWGITLDGVLHRSPAGSSLAFAKVGTHPASVDYSLRRLGQTLLIGSRDGVRFGENFRPVAGTTGLRSPRLGPDGDDLVWLAGEQSGLPRLGRLRTVGDTVTWEIVEAPGLTQLGAPRWLALSGDLLTITGENSILELNTAELKPAYRLAAPRLRFTYAGADGAPITSPAPPLELTAEKNSLTFTATLAFDEFGEHPAYERRLLPTEQTWIPAKSGEPITYPSLASRTYTLEVRTTHLGRTGATATATFTVLPPWYLSSAAFAGYAAFAALFFYLLYRLRTHQIRQHNLELERTVQERTRELAEASAAKTEFLASMSHEIRNPMNGVIGLVDILRESTVAPKQANTLRLLHNCAEQLRSTVDDILDFSKIEAGRIELEQSRFNLLDTLEAAAVTIDPTGHAVRFIDRPPPDLLLEGDAGKLRQIFANYVSNAVKYGIPPEARVSTILTPADGGVRLTLSVSSSGPTVDKDQLDKFFESFTRGTAAVERNIRGTGLGLAICKRYAQAMGGEVGAVSTNGETTFYLNVPFAKVGTEAIAQAAAPAPSALPARALAIEDEDYNRIVLGSILAKMNYTVDWATTGAEALRLARENGYDIVLTDYRLPDTNGVELTKEILRLCPDPKPAVFAVTAYSTRERRDECLGAGMVGFISKPITLEKLRATLANWGERQLTTISLETSYLRPPVRAAEPPEAIATAWSELKRAVAGDARPAAALAHQLNNLCRAHDRFGLAEQLELLEGALERGEPTARLVAACERLLRPSADGQSS